VGLNIHEIILQLIKVSHGQAANYAFLDNDSRREEGIASLTPILDVTEGPTPPTHPEFSLMVSKETPKESKFTWDDAMTIIVSEELYPYYLALHKDEFIKQFNKMLYDHIDVNLKEAKDKNVPDEDNIWMQPNAAFVKWFHENGIEIDKVKSFIEIEDDEYIYYKEKGLSEKKISYIRLCELTNKHIQENPQKEDGNTMSIRTAVKIVYKNNPGKFPIWGKNDLNSYYHLGQKLIINT